MPSSQPLNYVGVALACVSVVIYLFVKPETAVKPDQQNEKQPIESVSGEISINQSPETNQQQQQQGQLEKDNDDKMIRFLDRQSETTKRIIGSSLAIFSGFLYGQYSTPGLYTNQQFNK